MTTKVDLKPQSALDASKAEYRDTVRQHLVDFPDGSTYWPNPLLYAPAVKQRAVLTDFYEWAAAFIDQCVKGKEHLHKAAFNNRLACQLKVKPIDRRGGTQRAHSSDGSTLIVEDREDDLKGHEGDAQAPVAL